MDVPGAVTVGLEVEFSFQCPPFSRALPTLPVGSEVFEEVGESAEHVGAHEDTSIQPSTVELSNEVPLIVAAQFKTRTVIA